MTSETTASVAMLLLADARFPSGSHAHSGGLEAAVDNGRVVDLGTLEQFLIGRLRTAGLVDAALAAAVVVRRADPPWRSLEVEAASRIASPALRRTSRQLGRQLIRSARVIWPSAILDELSRFGGAAGPFHPIALGAVGVAAGIDVGAVALLAAHHAVAAPASAAVRLLGLDPVAVTALLARIGTERVAETARRAATGPLEALPGMSSTLIELEAEEHAAKEVRLFAS